MFVIGLLSDTTLTLVLLGQMMRSVAVRVTRTGWRWESGSMRVMLYCPTTPTAPHSSHTAATTMLVIKTLYTGFKVTRFIITLDSRVSEPQFLALHSLQTVVE